jgi:BTB/POZ domain
VAYALELPIKYTSLMIGVNMDEKTPDIEDSVGVKSDLERFDPEGNVLFNLNDGAQSFVVSSKILSLASPVFKALLAPHFSEGTKLAESGYTEISVYDDEPSAMNTMMSILHYQGANDLNKADPKEIAALAICCNKYDCVKPIRPWIESWLHRHPSTSSVEDYGFILLAAHLFRSSELFSDTFAEITKKLSPNFSTAWDQNGILAFLPSIVIGEIYLALPLLCSSTYNKQMT